MALTGYEGSSLEQVAAVLDGLDPATAEEVYRQTIGVSERAIATVAALRSSLAQGSFALPDVVSPYPLVSATAAYNPGANTARGCRVMMPKSGTLVDLAIPVVTASGNIDVGVYSTAATRVKLYSTGAIATPAQGWRIVGDPNLEVVAGEQYDLVLSASDGTASLARGGVLTNAVFHVLATGYLDDVAAAPKLGWETTTSHPLPNTFAEAACGSSNVIPLIAARVV